MKHHLLQAITIALGTTAVSIALAATSTQPESAIDAKNAAGINTRLTNVLKREGFTGRVDASLERRLGRELDPDTVNLGRLLFFDKALSLHNDNSCGGCHTPAFGFGDSQRIAIGVDNNNIVGPGRQGPRNQRRSPSVVNTAFYPALMWTPRFFAVSGDPFDASKGFKFPAPENNVTGVSTLLAAQGSIPSTELVEMAGFTGITRNPGNFGPRFQQFDDGHGQALPAPDANGFHNFPIQDAVNARINAIAEYRRLFGKAFNNGRPLPPGGITLNMRREALAEYQMSLVAANAPLDKFARGNHGAMTAGQKRGAVLFFGDAGCVACHKTSGKSNEMFSDFKARRIGGPQLAPVFGVGTGNVIYDGPGENEDFGFFQTEGDPALRYTFRTAPLRNLKVASGYFHNGAYGTLEAAIKHHLDVVGSLQNYNPRTNGVPADLRVGPYNGILTAGLDPLLPKKKLTQRDVADLTEFVRDGLFDERVLEFCSDLPTTVPSGLPMQTFQGCKKRPK